MTKIAAVIGAKNEWPLLAATASHALLNYADHLYLFDHSSTDGSRAGISELVEKFPGRITFFESDLEPFDQEAIFNILFFRACKDGYDWVHFLDADEFLVIEHGQQLSAILETVSEEWAALAIRVENFIINSDEELSLIDELLAANYRAKTELDLGQPIETFLVSVQEGTRLPQEKRTSPKLLVRAREDLFLSHGGHQLKYGNGVDWLQFDSRIAGADPLNLFIAHLPFTSIDRVRSRHKRAFLDKVNEKYRIVQELSGEESVRQFWRSSRLSPQKIAEGTFATQIVHDESFIASLQKTLDFLKKNEHIFSDLSEVASSNGLVSEQISVTELIENVRRYIDGADRYWARIPD